MFPLLKVTWNHTLPIYHMRLALVSWVPSVHIVLCIQVLEGDNKAFQVERQITLDKHSRQAQQKSLCFVWITQFNQNGDANTSWHHSLFILTIIITFLLGPQTELQLCNLCKVYLVTLLLPAILLYMLSKMAYICLNTVKILFTAKSNVEMFPL